MLCLWQFQKILVPDIKNLKHCIWSSVIAVLFNLKLFDWVYKGHSRTLEIQYTKLLLLLLNVLLSTFEAKYFYSSRHLKGVLPLLVIVSLVIFYTRYLNFYSSMSSVYFIHHFFLCLMQEISFPIERASEGDREREREREANGVWRNEQRYKQAETF